jgi:hypothetical protein
MFCCAASLGACGGDSGGNDGTSTTEAGESETTTSSSSSTIDPSGSSSSSSTTMQDERSSGSEGGSESSDGGSSSSSGESSTTGPELECSQDLFPIPDPGALCNGAIGILEGLGDCPEAAGWTMEPLDVGKVFCIYGPIPPEDPMPDFCTLPVSPTGQQPWEWLEIECADVGPG